ncbi:aminoglycoside phosphotransferase family protein [Desulfitobacterium sp. PCE1]|uniref:aminoglycoside phosphotransferase family protein n=1 Tax=Desulfitobacterium sp. PCE1 TaxID=146907 RepID=UPI000369BE1C|nr:aminoglycoside phosphotransferase family protein [Desulfitobacterium sp. PCE1]
MLQEQLTNKIKAYVNKTQFKEALQIREPIAVQFLAQGEYNLNYILQAGNRKLVFRLNTSSQMNLANQIGYEYQALSLLQDSGVTPIPLYLDDQQREIPYGCLVMEYLPGEPLNYARDLSIAAETFAKIHSLPLTGDSTDFLIQVEGPFSVIYQEAESLLKVYFECLRGDSQIKRLLEKVFEAGSHKRKEERYFLSSPWRAVINTEVNSHNFIVNLHQRSCHLIDWEKPIYGEPAQDLSMFLIPTTTLWKRNIILTPDQEELFLDSYLKAFKGNSQREQLKELSESYPQHPKKMDEWTASLANQNVFRQADLSLTLRERVKSFKFFNLLRAISWCAMAWTEYTEPGRPLVNQDTFEKIRMYLEEDFIKKCFPEVF